MLETWKHKLPTREKIFQSRLFKPFARYFNRPEYWAFSRDKVALSVAIGLFCGMLPAPTQFFSALVLAYLLRTQLPIALFATLYTNPITLIPLYIAAYEIGTWLLYGNTPHPNLVLPHWNDPNFHAHFTDWLSSFGKPLILGILTMGSTFASIGYAAVQIIWRWRNKNQQPTNTHT